MPFKPIQLSYGANPRYVEAYSTLFSGSGKWNYNTGNDITREDFPRGYAIYAFDLTADMCGSSPHFNVVQRGNLALDIKFSTAPGAAVSLVCYGELTQHIVQVFRKPFHKCNIGDCLHHTIERSLVFSITKYYFCYFWFKKFITMMKYGSNKKRFSTLALPTDIKIGWSLKSYVHLQQQCTLK